MNTPASLEVFCCYAREDEKFLRDLQTHLRPLEHQKFIKVWADKDIQAGADWKREIELHLNSAPIILLMISPDFMASDYCYGIEMKRALERHYMGEATVIPVILRPTDWHAAPFGDLNALPRNGTPILSREWHSSDDAYLAVVASIRNIVTNREKIQEEQRQFEAQRQHIARLRQEAEALQRAEAERIERERRAAEEEAEALQRAEAERIERERRAAEEKARREEEEKRRLEAEKKAAEEAKERILAQRWNYKYMKYRREHMNADAFSISLAAFLFSGGIGSVVGVITQQAYIAVGAAVMLALLAYFLGYNKAFSPVTLGIVAILGAVTAFGITLSVVTLNYDTSLFDNTFWHRILTLRHQIIAGMCIGAVSSLWGFYVVSSPNNEKANYGTNFAVAILFALGTALVLWLIVNLLGSIFNWGFGYGPGWNNSLVHGAFLSSMAFIGVIGVYAAWKFSQHAILKSRVQGQLANQAEEIIVKSTDIESV